jgi:excisionase family DNA binding protein
MPKLLTRREAAAALRICTRSLDRHVRDGGLPAVKVGGKILIHAEALDAWIRNLPGAAPTIAPLRRK